MYVCRILPVGQAEMKQRTVAIKRSCAIAIAKMLHKRRANRKRR